MIQIISGKYKGRKLKQVPDKYVRPTQAVIRKSVMQILEPLSGLHVLDLYAGVGTLGIEALSRGAFHLTAVEKNPVVFKVLKGNIDMVAYEDSVHLKCMDVNHFVKNERATYDIILADPPYSMCNYDELRANISNRLNPKGIFCMEMKKSPIIDDNIRIKSFGNKQVVFWSK